MKKIAILNFQHSNHNYGAVLQAAALEHTCRQLGHDAKHLDFIAQPRNSVKGRLGQLLRKMGLRKTPKARRISNQEAFERFRKSFITRTKQITSANEFIEITKTFDSVVVGSDQVWRPSFANDTMAYFLGYVSKGTDRVSYAASFGTAKWEQEDDVALTVKVSEELRQFKAVSCREESGVDVCKDVFGVEAAHVLDPLLLVDESFFEKLIPQSSVHPGSKLVYYKLDSSEDFQEDLEAIGSELGSKAVNIYHTESDVREYREVTDWLTLVMGSKVVVTDSFHCVCLALRFGKEVIYCPNERKGQTRLNSLFKQLHVDVEPLDFKLKTPMFKLYVHRDIEPILQSERKKSLKFLADALH